MEIKKNIKCAWLLLRDSAVAWDRDSIAQQGAALSYFTVFSISPLYILVTVLLSLAFGQEAASGQIVSQIRGLIGIDGAKFVQSQIKNANDADGSLVATLFGCAMLLFGASAVFVQLRESLNSIFRVKQKPTGTIHAFVRARLLAFAVVLGLGFLLIVSLIISSALTAVSGYLGAVLGLFPFLLTILDFVISFLGITVMFALMFRFVPAAVIRRKDAWIGAAVTSFLFSLGKQGIGLYLGNSAIGSTFGAASSLAIIMIWAYYSSQAVLLGAEFTYLYADRHGSHIRPKAGALSLPSCDLPGKPLNNEARGSKRAGRRAPIEDHARN